MRRLLSIALTSLIAVGLTVPTAQGATRYRYFQDHAVHAGHASISMTVAYKNKHGDMKFTPRWALYDFQVPTSCQVGGNPPIVGSSPGYTRETKLRKGKLASSNSNVGPIFGHPGFSFSNSVTGKVIKETKRVDGTVTVVNFTEPPTYVNCTSGGAIPYSATPCGQSDNNPPYIDPSLPVCTPAF